MFHQIAMAIARSRHVDVSDQLDGRFADGRNWVVSCASLSDFPNRVVIQFAIDYEKNAT